MTKKLRNSDVYNDLLSAMFVEAIKDLHSNDIYLSTDSLLWFLSEEPKKIMRILGIDVSKDPLLYAINAKIEGSNVKHTSCYVYNYLKKYIKHGEKDDFTKIFTVLIKNSIKKASKVARESV